MNVKQLIQALEGFSPEMEVHFSYNYGDHWRTIVAPSVNDVEEANVGYSEYHRMPQLLDDGYGSSVVVLS